MALDGYDSNSSSHDSILGLWILEQYRIVRILAKGGMSRVYLAEQPQMQRQAAIKIVEAQDGVELDEKQHRLRKEAITSSRLNHPNIITVYNHGELADGSLFLAMEFVQGTDLGQMLEGAPFDIHRVLDIAIQCVTALDYAHQHGVVHRDLKPENIMCTTRSGQEVVKILDFGIAKIVVDAPELGDGSETEAGMLLGTPRYMSPEQCRSEAVTPRCDQYSFGLVLYEMLVGAPAIDAESGIGYLHSHQSQEVRLPSEVISTPEIEMFDPVISRMLAKEPGDRMQSMAQVLAELRRIESVLDQQAGGEIEDQDPEKGTVRGTPSDRQRPRLGRRATDGGATVMERAEESPPVPVICSEASGLLDDAGRSALERARFEVSGSLLPTAQEQGIWLQGTDEARWRQDLSRWAEMGVPPGRQLVCIDAPLTSTEIVEVAAEASKVIIGPHPVEAAVVLAALTSLRGGGGVIEGLAGDHAIQLVQITSSSRKSEYVDQLIEDARTAGFHRRVLMSLAELGEEMILNAIFHAPVDFQGNRPHTDRDRSTTVDLPSGAEPTLRWVIHDDLLAVSVRDPFGSLEPDVVMARTTGAPPKPDVTRARSGVGMGLYMMARAASHLMIAINPGRWTEVVALLPRGLVRGARRRSLSLLRSHDKRSLRVGDRLRLHEDRSAAPVRLELEGEINETSDLRAAFGRSGQVTLDLGQVTRINSMGLRAWLDAAREAPDDLELSFEHCSIAIVRQLNMIPALTDGVRIASIMAPYYCEACKLEELEELIVDELGDDLPPYRVCQRCDRELEFDDYPEEYFAFLE